MPLKNNKGPDSKYFRLFRVYSLLQPLLKSAIVVESSHGPSVNAWTLLCSYKTLFNKQAAGWIWPCGAVVVLTPGVDHID